MTLFCGINVSEKEAILYGIQLLKLNPNLAQKLADKFCKFSAESLLSTDESHLLIEFLLELENGDLQLIRNDVYFLGRNILTGLTLGEMTEEINSITIIFDKLGITEEPRIYEC